jgi:hypothetical protein
LYLTDNTALPIIKNSHINGGLNSKCLLLYCRGFTQFDMSVGLTFSLAQRHRAQSYNVIASNSRFSQLRVGVAWTRLRARRFGARILVGTRDFPLLQNVKTGPSTLLRYGYLGPFPRVTRPRCKVNHSTPSRAEIKNGLNSTSIPPYTPLWCGQRKHYLLPISQL